MKPLLMSNDELLPSIEKIYLGRDSGCRCGCHGTYTKYHDNPENEGQRADNSRVKSIFTRGNKLINSGEGKITDDCRNYTNISYGNDRAICIYWL